MKTLTDKQVKNKGLRVLFQELGEADAIRFLSRISTENRDYLSVRDALFKGMNVDEIFEKAKEYSEAEGNPADIKYELNDEGGRKYESDSFISDRKKDHEIITL